MVDDSATNLLALESVLRAPDRNLIRANSGEEALRYLLDNEVAVVLLDVYMPGIDGLQTAELIRGREKSRDIPIIFLTANTTGQNHLSRGYSLGAVDYIVKPIDPAILRSKVAVFVDRDAHSALHFFRANSAGQTVSSGEVPAIIQQALRRVSTELRPVRLDESDELLLVESPEADNLHSFLGAAIVCGSIPRGWFYLLNKKDANEFTEADERLAQNLAAQVAIAYENATL